MGWFSTTCKRIGAGVSKAWSGLAASVNTVVADVAGALGNKEYENERREVAEDWRRKREKWDNRLKDLRVQAKVEKYMDEAEPKVVQKAKDVKSYFESRYSDRKASDKPRDMTVSEREEEIRTVAQDMVTVLDIKDAPKVEFVQPTEKESYMGMYDHSKNTLYVNLAYIDSNDPRAYTEQISTVVHEMLHVLQWQVMLSDDTQGFSKELVNSWRYNALHYVTDDPWLYRHQPLEAFTFGIENAIKENLK